MSTRRPRPIRKKGAIAAAQVQRRVPKGERLAFQVDPWTRRIVRPALTALLATSVAVALLVVFESASTEFNWLVVWPLAVFAALEGAYTAVWLNLPQSRGVERGTYRAAEILVLIVVARIFSWIVFGGGIPSPDEVRVYLATPISFFMRGGFITTTVVVLLTWWIATAISRVFAQLDLRPDEIGFYTLPTAEQKAQGDNRPIQISRDELQQQFMRLWLGLGMFMVLLAALSTFEVSEFATVSNPFDFTRLGLPSATLAALMIYFLAGLWLQSHARQLRLNARWLIDGVALQPSVERGWQRNTTLLIVLIALIAAFLPIGSTLAVSRILGLLVNGVLYLFGLGITFIGYIFAIMVTLLTRNVESLEQTPTEPLAPPPTPPPFAPAPPNPMFGLIISSVFWALLIAMIIAAIAFFLRERGYHVRLETVSRSWTTLREWASLLWLRFRRSVRATRRGFVNRLKAISSPAPHAQGDGTQARNRFVRVNGLTPREQVRYLYLSTVRRAGDRGIKRRDSETPLEYVQDLKQGWPEAGGDWELLTGAFLEARYSLSPIELEDVSTVRSHWKRLRSLLRRSAKGRT